MNPVVDLVWTVTKLALMIVFAPVLMLIGWSSAG